MSKKTSDRNLDELLDKVADEVVAILAKADEEEASLAKASPGQEAPGEETPPGSSAEGSDTPEQSPGDAGGVEQSPGEQDEGTAGAPEGTPEGTEAAPEGSAEQTQNPATDESGSPEALVAEYAKLPVEELKLHAMAAQQALINALGGKSAEGAAPGPEVSGMAPEGTAPAGNPEPEPPAPPIGKKEFGSDGSGGQIAKSEIDLRLETLEKALKAKDEEMSQMQAQLEQAAEGIKKFVTKVTGVGLRKSVAGVSEVAYIGKPGEEKTTDIKLSRPEILAKLNVITATPDLKKSDREAVNRYVIGVAPVETIAHLLK